MIQITPTAAQEIRRIQRSRNAPDSFLRLSVAKGGCLDFIYQFDQLFIFTKSHVHVSLMN